MSKMSQLHAELSEQAYELGFESLGEAEQAGYGVDWENHKLIKVEDELDKAHEAWLEERERALHWLEKLSAHLKAHKAHDIFGGYLDYEVVDMGIKIIKEGEL